MEIMEALREFGRCDFKDMYLVMNYDQVLEQYKHRAISKHDGSRRMA